MTATKKRFLIERTVASVTGTQVFAVDAFTEKEALANLRAGEGDVYATEVEVTKLGRDAEVIDVIDLPAEGADATTSNAPADFGAVLRAHIADLRKTAIALREPYLLGKFEATALEFERAASELVAGVPEGPMLLPVDAASLIRRLADHLENAEGMPLLKWGAKGATLVADARRFLSGCGFEPGGADNKGETA